MVYKIGPNEVTQQRKKENTAPGSYVARPSIFPNGGTFTPEVEVTLACSTAGSTIYYTDDGTRPSEASTEYTVPFTISDVGVTRIRAFAVKTGKLDSAYVAADFNVTATVETVATPLIVPASGTFESSVSVTMSCATSGAAIRYTTDGSAPTEFSTLYTGVFAITTSGTTLRAKAFKSGMNASAISSAVYTITAPPDPPNPPTETVGTPTISPNGGSFLNSVQITLATATEGASIYYTQAGNTPSQSSNLYTGPFTINTTRTIKAKAFKTGMNESGIATANFTITQAKVATPTISPNGGTHAGSVEVTLACATPGATINYTLDAGSVNVYTAPFTITSTATLRVQGVLSGYVSSDIATAVFTISSPEAVATPTISPNGGSFVEPTPVTLACATAGASIYYTTDGSTPDATDTLYTGTFNVAATTTVKAIGIKSGQDDSAIASAVFTLSVATPVISPSPDGTYQGSVDVTLSCDTVGAAIYYTTNGDTPTAGSTLYEDPFTLASTSTVKAIGILAGLSDSAVESALFTIVPLQVATPTISPNGGIFADPVEVTLACTTSGAAITYSVNGGAYGAYTVPFTVSVNTTLLVKATKAAMTDSEIASAVFTIGATSNVLTPTISPNGGTFDLATQPGNVVTITLACETAGATIRYTTNGSTPSASNGTLYSAPFNRTSSGTIKAIGLKEGLTDSLVAEATFTIIPLPVVATPTITPNGGAFQSSVEVSMACSTSGATIRYTTDGTTPGSGATPYTGPFKLYHDTTVRARGFKSGMSSSTVRGAQFTVAAPAPSPGGEEFTVPLSIDSTGTDDVTVDLFEFIAEVPNGTAAQPNVIIFQPDGVYKTEMTLQLFKKRHIVIRGEGATLQAFTDDNGGTVTPSAINPAGINYGSNWPRQRQHVHVVTCENIVIRDLMVRGPKPPTAPFAVDWEGQHAYEFNGCAGIELDNCSCYGVWGDGMGFRSQQNAAGEFHWCEDIWVHGGSFQVMGRQGIVPLSVYNLLIEDCTFSNIKRSWIDIEITGGYPAAGVLNATFRNIVANGINNTFFTNGAFCHAVDKIVLENIQTDGIMRVLIPFSKEREPWVGRIEAGGKGVLYNKARRGEYTFRNIVCTSGQNEGSGSPPVRADGATRISVVDCVQDIGAPEDTFVRVNENHTVVDISGNTGNGVVEQYELVEDPTVANEGLRSGIDIETGLYIEEAIQDMGPMPTAPLWRPPFF